MGLGIGLMVTERTMRMDSEDSRSEEGSSFVEDEEYHAQINYVIEINNLI